MGAFPFQQGEVEDAVRPRRRRVPRAPRRSLVNLPAHIPHTQVATLTFGDWFCWFAGDLFPIWLSGSGRSDRVGSEDTRQQRASQSGQRLTCNQMVWKYKLSSPFGAKTPNMDQEKSKRSEGRSSGWKPQTERRPGKKQKVRTERSLW